MLMFDQVMEDLSAPSYNQFIDSSAFKHLLLWFLICFYSLADTFFLWWFFYKMFLLYCAITSIVQFHCVCFLLKSGWQGGGGHVKMGRHKRGSGWVVCGGLSFALVQIRRASGPHCKIQAFVLEKNGQRHTLKLAHDAFAELKGFAT